MHLSIPYNKESYLALGPVTNIRAILHSRTLSSEGKDRRALRCQTAHALVTIEAAAAVGCIDYTDRKPKGRWDENILEALKANGSVDEYLLSKVDLVLAPIFDMVDAVKRIFSLVWEASNFDAGLSTSGAVSVFHCIDWFTWFSESSDVDALRECLRKYVRKLTDMADTASTDEYFKVISEMAAEPVFINTPKDATLLEGLQRVMNAMSTNPDIAVCAEFIKVLTEWSPQRECAGRIADLERRMNAKSTDCLEYDLHRFSLYLEGAIMAKGGSVSVTDVATYAVNFWTHYA